MKYIYKTILCFFVVIMASAVYANVEFIEYNPFTNKLDATIEGSEFFSYDPDNFCVVISTNVKIEGKLMIGTKDTYFFLDVDDFELWVNAVLAQRWTQTTDKFKLTEDGDFKITEAGDSKVQE